MLDLNEYIAEIDGFNNFKRTNQLPKSAIALWHSLMRIYLIEDRNEFAIEIMTLESETGFKRSELFEARNTLTQKGRITWKSKGGSGAPVYSINLFHKIRDSCVRIADTTPDTTPDAKADTNPDANRKINGKYHNISSIVIDNTINSIASITDIDLKKEKKLTKKEKKQAAAIQVIPFWDKMVETWFNFYKENYEFPPTFNGIAGSKLREIVKSLEKLSVEKGFAWSEQYAVYCFTAFLKLSHSDKWLRANFLLPILAQKFDSIINRKNGSDKGLTEKRVNGKSAGAYAVAERLLRDDL